MHRLLLLSQKRLLLCFPPPRSPIHRLHHKAPDNAEIRLSRLRWKRFYKDRCWSCWVSLWNTCKQGCPLMTSQENLFSFSFKSCYESSKSSVFEKLSDFFLDRWTMKPLTSFIDQPTALNNSHNNQCFSFVVVHSRGSIRSSSRLHIQPKIFTWKTKKSEAPESRTWTFKNKAFLQY